MDQLWFGKWSKMEIFAWKLCREVSTARYVKKFGCCKGTFRKCPHENIQSRNRWSLLSWYVTFFQQLRHLIDLLLWCEVKHEISEGISTCEMLGRGCSAGYSNIFSARNLGRWLRHEFQWVSSGCKDPKKSKKLLCFFHQYKVIQKLTTWSSSPFATFALSDLLQMIYEWIRCSGFGWQTKLRSKSMDLWRQTRPPTKNLATTNVPISM